MRGKTLALFLILVLLSIACVALAAKKGDKKKKSCKVFKTCAQAEITCVKRVVKLACHKWQKTNSGVKCISEKRKSCCLSRQRVCKHYHWLRWCPKPKPKDKLTINGPVQCPDGQILTFTEKSKKLIERKCVPGTPEGVQMCYSFMDPHHYTYKEGYFWDMQDAGDFVFAKTSDRITEVHYRTKMQSDGFSSAVVGVAVKLNGIDTIEYLGGQGIRINRKGKYQQLADGQKIDLEKNGGSVQRVETSVIFLAPNYVTVVASDRDGGLMDVFVNTPDSLISSLKGICQQEKIVGKGLFTKPHLSKFMDTDIKKPKPTAESLVNADTLCSTVGVKGKQKGACVEDVVLVPETHKQKVAVDHSQVEVIRGRVRNHVVGCAKKKVHSTWRKYSFLN